MNNKSIHRWGSSRHLNRPYVRGELPLQSPVFSRLLLTNSFPQTCKTNSHQLLLAWQKEGFYILLVELHWITGERQILSHTVKEKYSGRRLPHVKSKKAGQEGGDDIRNSLIKDLHCIGLKFMSSDLSRSRKQLSGCKDRIEQGLPTQMMIDYFRGTTEYSDLRPQGAEYVI